MVPVGTVVINVQTDEVIGDLTRHGDRLLVAKGGKGGLGNMHFKSSVNRAPRQSTTGEEGEERLLKLELRLLADVGLLGFPNAGKSTLIRAVSSATPKVADYPFTTLYPNLGVVSVEAYRSFVIADVPGLIEGAADGAGWGRSSCAICSAPVCCCIWWIWPRWMVAWTVYRRPTRCAPSSASWSATIPNC